MTEHPTQLRLAADADEILASRYPLCGALIQKLLTVHASRESCSINTLGCPAHDVRVHLTAVIDIDVCEACPDCVVTPITVCSAEGCESYPCETIQTIMDVLDQANEQDCLDEGAA